MKKAVQLTPELLVPRLGDYLVEKGLLPAEDLRKALDYQHAHRDDEHPVLLGQVLVNLGLISRTVLDQSITEQILQLRTALQDSNRRLEKRVQERTAELEDALQKLSTVNQLKSNIVANISHELRTPLTHIEGYLELLNARDLGTLNDDQVNAVRVMIRASERLERLIEDLILFSQTEREEISLRITPLQLNELLSSILPRSREKAAERKVEFELICPAELPVVESDGEKISWVILQLLDNAIKFTPVGGHVRLSLRRMERYVHISVEDTGIGIPVQRIPEIFEPFLQLDGSSTRKYGGTGLGLALVQKIVEAHGSKVTVTSVVGKGSKFEFSLKIAPSSGGNS